MTFTLDLNPETEQCLCLQAEREGQDMTTYLESVMERISQDPDAENALPAAQAEKNKAAREALHK